MQNKKIEKGMRFGWLTCKGMVNESGFGGATWLCMCDCGNEVEASEAMLLSGVMRNCGCKKSRSLNLKGQKFGWLTVLEPVYERAQDGSVCWICRCECGKYVTQSSNLLRMGRSISCGCQKGVVAKNAKTYIDGTCVQIMMSDTVSKNNTSGYRGVAEKRDKWQAYISYSGKRIPLGDFETKEQAAKARKKAEQKIREHLVGLMNGTKVKGTGNILEIETFWEELKRTNDSDKIIRNEL